MLNVYLFIELLGGVDAGAAVSQLKSLELQACRVVHAVTLNAEKVVAQIDCRSLEDANHAMLQRISGVDGVVQTNIIAVVKPRN